MRWGLDMITNLRDIGGYRSAYGKQVVCGKIYRSGELYKMSPADQEEFAALKIKTIVDFRSQEEVKTRPDDQFCGVTYVTIDILADAADQNGSLAAMMQSKETAHEAMIDIYHHLVTCPSAQKGYHEFLSLLLQKSNTPLLFHCFAGKDRTGYAAALILRILGVSDADIFKDYLKTNEQRKQANELIIQNLQATKQLSETQIAQLRPMLEVTSSDLEAAFTKIDDIYGDFNTYLEQGLQFSKADQEQLRQLYLV